jgi:hypothetical protein
MVIRHAAFLPAVNLHISGIQIDGDRPVGQLSGTLRRHQRQHPPSDHRDTAFDRLPLLRADPAGQARRRRGR